MSIVILPPRLRVIMGGDVEEKGGKGREEKENWDLCMPSTSVIIVIIITVMHAT